ncbi:MAG: hypothetical protein KME55_30160 [Nostoc indistinguendum CM1-VF10]|jgi:hypothetical protein|nr:hypothetical protein [Nostoc indistinguendum CM1-VF10]
MKPDKLNKFLEWSGVEELNDADCVGVNGGLSFDIDGSTSINSLSRELFTSINEFTGI